MSQMKELYEKVSKDTELKVKFAEIMKEAEKNGEEETKKKLIAFAKGAGYEVSFEEVKGYSEKLAGQKEGSLSDAELDMVAGGKSISGIGRVMMSVCTVGMGCGASSVLLDQQGKDCGEWFE